ncbi:ATP-binding protein [Azospirillum agricola]|uniref:ATP-binding protein n=1 Tax=Azospirillum agricola TaxID=1720247 RepID=UPI0015C437AB|nr:ATP-binding protein [Azospirillum agricola]
MLREQLQGEMEALSQSVQRTLSQEIAYLSGVAISKTLDSDNLDDFRAEAELARRMRPTVSNIILNDERRQIFNLRLTPDQPRPSLLDPESLSAVWITRQPVIGNLVNGKIALRVPVLRQGQVRYVLSEIITHQTFDELLSRNVAAKGWIAALIDGSMTILARSEQGEAFVGASPTPSTIAAIQNGRTELGRTTMKSGAPAYGAVVPIPGTGWYLMMSIPDSVAERSYRPVRLLLVAGGGLALLAAIALALSAVWSRVGRLESQTRTLSTDLDDAHRQSDEMSAFLAMMSHELRTPLTGILGFSDLLAKSPLDDQQREWVTFQRATGQTLMSIINDILDYSKIEAGRVELEIIDFDLRRMLRQCIALVKPMAAIKALSIRVEVAPDMPRWLRGDPTRLQQVIGNLLNNAVKFTEHGEIRLFVGQVPEEEGRSRLRVAVQDTGIGIPADRCDRLFQRFSQANSSTTREYGGTGLGLAICKSLVELMGGRIGVDSIEGRGSSFWFEVSLPLAAAPAADAAPAEPARGQAGARILLVEDNRINQILARTVLERAGYDVMVAGDGAEAVAAVRRAPVDLVLMDLHLPVLDGAGATRAIRALDGPTGGVPILALTADAFHSTVAACREAGMDGHVAKPFFPNDLLAAVDEALRRGRPAGPADTPAPAASPPPRPAPPRPPRPKPSMPKPPRPESAMRDAMASAIGETHLVALQDAFLKRAAAARTELIFARADRDALCETAHRLIGAAGMLGYSAIVSAARALCEACRTGDEGAVVQGVATLVAELNRLPPSDSPGGPATTPEPGDGQPGDGRTGDGQPAAGGPSRMAAPLTPERTGGFGFPTPPRSAPPGSAG